VHEQENPLHKANVLIVDDDATICLLMKDALTAYAYNITIVNNGKQALLEIKKHQPDLVLLDVTMPGIDGFEVCAKIRKLYGKNKISIVMVTALEDSVSIEKSYEHGATDFISKPITWDTFPYRIKYLLKARSAIVKTQQHQFHLEYVEHISRIITQNKNKDVLMQETMFAMLDIFAADRIALLKSNITYKEKLIVDCETAVNDTKISKYLHTPIIDTLDTDIFERANISEFPITTNHTYNNQITQQIVSALHINHSQTWYLVLQQYNNQRNWTSLDEETFYKISLRLTNMLSRYLYTEEISQSEQLLKQTQKIAHLGNWNWNITNNLLTWSDEIYRIYGFTKQSFTPTSTNFFSTAIEHGTKRLRLLRDIQSNTIQSYQLSYKIEITDGSVKWINESCIGLYDDFENIREINGIIQDITETHRKKEQEAHNNKMEAIGLLTSGVAHDFGNLMTVAKGNIDLLDEILLDNNNYSPDCKELVDDIQSVVNDSVQLTKQLLSFSRKKSIAPIFVNIKNTFDKFETLFKKTIGSKITLSIDIESNVNDIFVDPSQFESALLNIIINAKNAMPNGGEIKINASVMTAIDTNEIIRNTHNNLGDEYVCITIRDNGNGMDEYIQNRAIEPFFTTKGNQGTGLGLSMVFGFVKQSNGELTIKSQPEEGTLISLQFPILVGTAIDKKHIEPTSSLQHIQATILIVEDQHKVKKFAVRCLDNPGITLLEADNAATARKLLNTNNVDLLFTDIVMPGDMDGQQLAQWAVRKHHDLKILLTTATENKEFLEFNTTNTKKKEINEDQEFKLLPKPYSKNNLIENVVNLLDSTQAVKNNRIKN